MEDLSFPIGRFTPEPELTEGRRIALINDITAAPAALREAVHGMTKAQLDTPYRPAVGRYDRWFIISPTAT